MKYKILVLKKKNIKDFSEERNKMIANCDTDWILFLDSDEYLDTELTIVDDKYESFYLYRKNFFLGQYVGTDKIIRLIKKGTGRFVREVHEVWIPKNEHLVGEISNNYIIHNTADKLSNYLNKINNYSNLHAKSNLREGKKSNLFKIIFFPLGKFIVYLIKSRNITFSITQAFHSYLSWTKLYLRQY